jgi:hypothetical protein
MFIRGQHTGDSGADEIFPDTVQLTFGEFEAAREVCVVRDRARVTRYAPARRVDRRGFRW